MKMRDLAIWGLLAMALVAVFSWTQRTATTDPASAPRPYSQVMAEVDAGRVKAVAAWAWGWLALGGHDQRTRPDSTQASGPLGPDESASKR